MIFIAYKITCLINGKIYIGITTRTLRQRWGCHTWSARNRGGATAISAAIRKYGPENFRIEAVAQARDFKSLKQLERDLIAQEGCLAPDGYNLTTGGEGTRGYVQSSEHRRKHSEALSGRKLSPEHIEKLRSAMKGREFTPEWRQRISAAKKGKGPSAEQAKRHSEKMRGKKMPPRTAEHRAKLAANAKAQWDQLRATDPEAFRLQKPAGVRR